MEELKGNHSEESLIYELSRTNEDLEAHRQYLEAVKSQVSRVKKTVMKPIPCLYRQAPYNNGGKVSYYIGVHWQPQVCLMSTNPYEQPYAPSTDCERLTLAPGFG